ncbi:MAG TPA: hypothetical protein VEI73_04790 [Candidatus Acidoferrum sp.]|nr:hypothetical protein [Candidatus Acidoferrum sp.]
MEEYQQENQNGNRPEREGISVNRWLVLAAVALFAAAGLAFGYGYRQQITVGHLTAQESMANATINQLQGQVNTLTAKLNDMVAAQQEAAAKAAAEKTASQSASQPQAKPAAGSRPAAKHGMTAADKRYKELQVQLEAQQKELKETQDLVAKNRSDLEGSLSSTRDELNGSIAKTHEELVALEKKGERSYYEFDLEKSKQFQRVGPLTLSLRKADTKHKSFDVQMIVDDNRLTKKGVNLYEPIWIHSETDGQPVQVVVNRIEKNLVHGYVSAPKYKASELAATGGANVTPVAAHPQTPDLNPPSTPKQP